MFEFLSSLFDTSGFPARWNCGVWTTAQGTLHIASDIAIWAAYTAIPVVIVYFVLRRKDVPYSNIFWLFGAFILACGTTHLIEAVIFWHPVYRLAGVVKLLTAVISWGTVIALVQITPKALRLPGLAKLNDELLREVHERKSAEVALHDNRLLLQNVLDNTPALIYVKDRDGRLLVVNRHFAKLLDVPFEGLVGRSDREVFGDANWNAIAENDRRVFATHVPLEFEEVLQLPDGPHTFISVKAPVDVNYPGAVLCGVSTDITGRKRDEDRLRHSEERLRLALGAGRMGTWELEIGKNRVAWSAELESIHGFAAGGFPGTPEAFHATVHPEDLPRVRRQIQETMEKGHDLHQEYRIVSVPGATRWVESRGQLFRDDLGRPERVSGVCMDVTSRKLAEEERERLLDSERSARNEAERASRVKDEFLSLVSHELRAPLNAILGYAQLLQVEGQKPEDVKEAVQVIERNGRAQAQIIEDLLDMGRIVSGKLRLDVQSVDLVEVIKAAADTVRPAADAKGIHLHMVLDSRGGRVLGDSGRLQQVVWNLLANAIKFTNRQGRVQVSLERVNSHVEIRVADTGQGIKPEFLPFVYERFRQQDASSSRQYGGLGIGLSLVKHLVEFHGGTVDVFSEGENRGATFLVALPVQISLPEASDERAHPAVEGTGSALHEAASLISGLKVLLVDDEPDARAVARRFLEGQGVLITTAESAEEALRVIPTARPDVIMSDIGMPQTDGYEFARQLRALSEADGGRTPAAALTAFARSEDRTRALLAGYQAHITKPINPGEFVAVIAALAGRIGK